MTLSQGNLLFESQCMHAPKPSGLLFHLCFDDVGPWRAARPTNVWGQTVPRSTFRVWPVGFVESYTLQSFLHGKMPISKAPLETSLV